MSENERMSIYEEEKRPYTRRKNVRDIYEEEKRPSLRWGRHHLRVAGRTDGAVAELGARDLIQF